MACQILAKVLCRSVGADAPPLTSFQLRYPRIIHAELMTHRAFSRNARSSRAVPVSRMLEEIRTEPFIPRYWGANQKGMQASKENDTPVYLPVAAITGRLHQSQLPTVDGWLWARDRAVEAASAFADADYHKQVVNRLLEPFMHIDTVLTSVDLRNWDHLRIDPAAEPHIRDLAVAMREAVEDYGDPVYLREDEWHLPYVNDTERMLLPLDWSSKAPAVPVALSVTRCAQVSYTPFHEARLTIEQEVERHDRLITSRPVHASPLEHQATPDRIIGRDSDGDPIWEHPKLHGNLTGWVQYRKTIAGERA